MEGEERMQGSRDAEEFGPVFTLTAGPSGSTQTTSLAMGQAVAYDYDPSFLALYRDVVGYLGEAFGSAEPPVILHGEAVLGLEAAAASLISDTDVVLNLVSGVYGKGFGFWARRYAAEVVELEVPFDSAVDAEEVGALLAQRPDITIVAGVHCETPSGTINDLGAIGPIVHNHGALFLVDAVSSFGGMPTDFLAWQVDMAVVGPQKCLGGPPGLSLVYVTEAAWDHMAANTAAPRSSILSILDWRDAHLVDRRFPFTPSVSEIYALEAILRQYLNEGPSRVHARHRQAARATRAGVQALGFELWAKTPAICSDTVTALKIPKGVDEAALRERVRRESGVMLSGGQGELIGKVLRIGHMGPAAYPMAPVLSVTGLGRALRSFGHSVDIGGAVEAVIGELDKE